ncbi:hypothetical protein [Roseibium sp.]|uniref:hypothetical protein n=1 Tax=Roseibium sp. TaxID=1936156 RepID=UPI003BA97376
MVFTWHEFDDGDVVLNPEADFRVNTLSRAIAAELAIKDSSDLWWLLVLNPALKDRDTNTPYSLEEIWQLAAGLGLGDDPSAFLAIPPEYPSSLREAPAPATVTLYARTDYINAANAKPEAAGIGWLEVGPSFLRSELILPEDPFTITAPERFKVPEGSVVMAVIDNGMAVGHELFRRTHDCKAVSRVKFFWNMDGVPNNPSSLPDNTEPASIGNAWTGTGLSEQLNKHMHHGLLDDPAFYRAIGATDWSTRRHTPIAHRLSHGTHVMGLAAGYPAHGVSDPDEAKKRPIIAVNLRTSDVKDPSGRLFSLWLEQALFYILDRHKRIEIEGQPGVRPPLVINFSFGNYAGPHDGTGLVEAKIRNALSTATKDAIKCQFVLPAGNGNESRCHARVELHEGARTQTLNWRVQPSDGSMSAVQIWLDKENKVKDDYAVLTVDGPGGIAPATISSHHPLAWQELRDENDDSIGLIYFAGANIGPYKRGRFGILLFATDSPEDVGPFAPSGIWTLQLTAPNPTGNVGMKAWVVRDETLPGFPVFGRQSYFDDPEYARFYEPGLDIFSLDRRLIGGRLGYDPDVTSALVRRQGTLSGFATGDMTVVVGGFRDSEPKYDCPMALYSATGPTNNPAKTGPDASGRSDDSLLLPGVVSAGSRSGSFVAMPGTSVSAPQVARWIAGELANGQPAGPEAVRDAADTMDPSGWVNPRKPPNIRSGGGRMLDLPTLFGQSRWPGPSR